ncbi:MAG TPA: hypothetical protein PKY81_07365 [bacterium]|nr:hypothetical protein [bacterium]
MTNYIAIDFIHIFHKFIDLVPDKNDWNESALMNNKPRYYLYKQVKSLLSAFELGEITEFENGNFILKQNEADFEKSNLRFVLTNSLLEDFNIPKDKYLLESQIYDKNSLLLLFKHLWEYRKIIEKLLRFNDGYIQTSGFETFACEIVDRYNSKVKEELKLIEDILSLIISPDKKNFTEKDLIEKYNFPIKDFEDIDLI